MVCGGISQRDDVPLKLLLLEGIQSSLDFISVWIFLYCRIQGNWAQCAAFSLHSAQPPL